MSSTAVTETLEAVARLDKDVKAAVITMGPHEVRYLVDAYYLIQENRVRASNQVFALSGSVEPHEVLTWFYAQAEILENQVKRALKAYADSQPLGVWSQSICGIAEILTAGLLAHIDLSKCKTVGQLWRFAGLSPDSVWISSEDSRPLAKKLWKEHKGQVDKLVVAAAGLLNRKMEAFAKTWESFRVNKLNDSNLARAIANGTASDDDKRMAKTLWNKHKGETREIITEAAAILKCDEDVFADAWEKFRSSKPSADNLAKALALRPWNGRLKVLCWKIGESFEKQHNKPKDVYGKVYLNRKLLETAKSDNGDYADQAAAKLEKYKIGTATQAYPWYAAGKLPPGHLRERAKRYAVKFFLSHYHAVGVFIATGKLPPRPYAFDRLGHVDILAPSNMDMVPGMTEAWAEQNG